MILVSEIAELLQGKLIGDANIEVETICSPGQSSENAICVAGTAELFKQAVQQEEIVALVCSYEPVEPCSKALILVANPQQALVSLLEQFAVEAELSPGIDPSATVATCAQISASSDIGANVVIGKQSIIGERVIIHPNVVIGDNVQIGDDCCIYPNVTIYNHSQIHQEVVIHAGCVIGSDGFGYRFNGQSHKKLQHIGHVVIESQVEIGANTTIDRATMGVTRIGQGTKIDNLVQIAHNVELGKHNILCAYTGIAGSTTAGDHVIFAAGVGVGDHVTIEDNVTLGPRTGIPSNKRLPSNTTWLGNPGRLEKKAFEQIVLSQRLPGMKKLLNTLKQRVDELENKD